MDEEGDDDLFFSGRGGKNKGALNEHQRPKFAVAGTWYSRILWKEGPSPNWKKVKKIAFLTCNRPIN